MTKFKYDKAVKRLEEISLELDGELDDISRLSELVKESTSLIKMCKKELRSTEDEINKTFDSIDEK